MKTKIISLAIIGIIALGLMTAVQSAQADTKICFKPNVPIPGMSGADFFGAPSDACKGGYEIDKDSIGKYINTLYNYAARLASVVAMFMIVFASWQWMMAAGNASKIDNAKDTIQGALIGLALLFAGQLLLNSISSRLVNFGGLEIPRVDSRDFGTSTSTFSDFQSGQQSQCSASGQTQTVRCGSLFNITVNDPYTYTLQCYGYACDNSFSCVYLANINVPGDPRPVRRYFPCPAVFNRSSNDSPICTCVSPDQVERINGPEFGPPAP